MARGRGGSVDSSSLMISTRRRNISPHFEPLDVGRKAYRLGHSVDIDAADVSKKSRDRDRKLLNDITQRLNRIEYDDVRLSRDVAEKTGFRRYIYNKPLVPVEKETRERRRRNELKYPWDNTRTDNVFRGVRQSRTRFNINKKLPNRTDKDKEAKYYRVSEYSELPEGLPEYDPMGVYRPRPRRERKDYGEMWSATAKKYKDMPLRELVARTHARIEAMPRHRDTQRDVDDFLADVTRPLPKNDMSNMRVVTVDDHYDVDDEFRREGLDDHLKSKIRASHNELEEFDKMLELRFSGRKKTSRSFVVPTRRRVLRTEESYRLASRAYSEPPYRRSAPATTRLVTPSALLAVTNARLSLDRIERELGIEPSFDEPTVIHRQSRPIVRASPAPIRRTVARSVHATPTLRVRSSSVPASPRAVPRHRARLAEIEGIYSDYDTDWSYVPVKPYVPANISHTCSQARRPRSTSASRPRPISVVTSYEPSLPPRPIRRKRMPELDPYRPHMGSIKGSTESTVKVEPYKPVNLSKSNPVRLGPAPRGDFRPHMSDTRRRIRDVICSTRKDPHYFA